MNTFLAVIGIITLGIGLLLILFLVKVGKRVKSKVNQQIAAQAIVQSLMSRSDKFELVHKQDNAWMDLPEMVSQANDLKALGYQPVGYFGLKTSDQLGLVGFVNEEARAYATAVHHANGCSVDFFVIYEDFGSLTLSNSQLAGNLNPMPGARKMLQPNTTVHELCQSLPAKDADRPRKAVSAATFEEDMITFSEAEIAWSKESGASPLEVTKFAAMSGMTLDPYQLELPEPVFGGFRDQRLKEARKACMDAWLETHSEYAAQWESIKDRVVVIHEGMNLFDFKPLLPPERFSTAGQNPELLECGEDAVPYDVMRPMIENFQAMNLAYPEQYQLKPLGEISSPMDAVLYLRPQP